MRVLIIGSGGREHALAWKIAQSRKVKTIYCAPGNPGVAALNKGECVNVGPDDLDTLKLFVEDRKVGLIVVGPEAPLVDGFVDAFADAKCKVFGPVAAAARLEGSKAFAKQFMRRHNIPTAAYEEFEQPEAALEYVHAQGAPIVVKADGLAAGKGVTVAQTVEEAETAIQNAMVQGAFGAAGERVVIEECLVGEEASILAFCDGTRAVPMASSQDHKPVFDNDKGPNTGGMGAYSPAPVVTDEIFEQIEREILRPAVEGMAQEGVPYRGILYAGLMITERGPKVVEFNVRFGDPETQVVLPRMKSDIVPIFEACCDGTLEDLSIEYDAGPCVTVVMASGGYPGTYQKEMTISGIDDAERDENVMVFHAGTKRTGGLLMSNGGRVLNVTARGATLRETIDRAYTAVGRIHFDGAYFRRDIGQKALKRL